jgi:hypothetical protein
LQNSAKIVRTVSKKKKGHYLHSNQAKGKGQGQGATLQRTTVTCKQRSKVKPQQVQRSAIGKKFCRVFQFHSRLTDTYKQHRMAMLTKHKGGIKEQIITETHNQDSFYKMQSKVYYKYTIVTFLCKY